MPPALVTFFGIPALVLITITNTADRATDLGFLLHKNPANLHSADLAFGKAYVFYSSATTQRCTACLLLELDPVEPG